MKELIISLIRTCSVADCDKAHDSRGLCGMHYMRLKRYGDANQKPRTMDDYFWTHVNKTDTCWLWNGAVTNGGYGKYGNRSILAHRYSYEKHNGHIPDGMQIDHLCMTKACVNPSHLEAVTAKENMHRMNRHYKLGVAKTHCPHGHEYTERNTRITKTNRRCCRECEKLKQRDIRLIKKGVVYA